MSDLDNVEQACVVLKEYRGEIIMLRCSTREDNTHLPRPLLGPVDARFLLRKGFESSAKGLRLETIAANVKTTDDYHYLWNSDIPCQKEGTPFEYIHEVRI